MCKDDLTPPSETPESPQPPVQAAPIPPPAAEPPVYVSPIGIAYTPVPYTPPQPSPTTLAFREVVKQKKSVLLLLLGFLGCYFYCEVMIQGSMSGLGIPLYLTVFYAIAFWFLMDKKDAFPTISWILLIPVALLSWSFAYVDSPLTNFITTMVLFVTIPLQLSVMAGKTKLSSPAVIRDTFMAVMGDPITHMGSTFEALSARKSDKKKHSGFWLAVAGIVCSVPVILIFFALFSSGDEVFRTAFEGFFSRIQFDATDQIVNLILAFILALFVIPVFFSLRAEKPKSEKPAKTRGALPAVVIISFLFGIILIQGFFAAIQISYLFPGANGGLRIPASSSYAEFARSGFAQISTASILTALIIALCFLMCRKNEKGALPFGVKLCLTVLACLDGVLCASAYARMFLYIDQWGYSVLRVNTCWLMALTMLLVLGLLLKVWTPRLKLFTWTATCVLVMTVALNCLNTDRLVARLNIDRYIASNCTSQLDTGYFLDLSPAALPELKRLRDTPVKELGDIDRTMLTVAIEGKEDIISSRTFRNHVFYFN